LIGQKGSNIVGIGIPHKAGDDDVVMHGAFLHVKEAIPRNFADFLILHGFDQVRRRVAARLLRMVSISSWVAVFLYILFLKFCEIGFIGVQGDPCDIFDGMVRFVSDEGVIGIDSIIFFEFVLIGVILFSLDDVTVIIFVHLLFNEVTKYLLFVANSMDNHFKNLNKFLITDEILIEAELLN
jgi:hypothetical protein